MSSEKPVVESAVPAAAANDRAGAAARRIRELLRSSVFPTDGHRKAAIRRVVHEGAAGLTEPEAALFLDAIRERFPDRAWSSVASARDLGARVSSAEADVERLTAERDALRARLDAIEARLRPLVAEAALAEGSRTANAAARPAASVNPESLGPLIDALSRLLSVAADLDASLTSVEDAFGRGRRTTPAFSRPVRDSIARLMAPGAKSGDELADLDRRLARIRLLPIALLAGIQQSWKGGTVQLLEHLDPKSCEEAVSSRLPVLRDQAVLAECRSRFAEFWNQLDQNIDHFYRAVLEKVYSEKMEDPK
ncbi:MAG: hypothetical protein ACKVU1_11360 [bacterium]